MPILSPDTQPRQREEIRAALHQALRDNNTDAYYAAFDEMMERVAFDVRQEYDSRFSELADDLDARVLAARGHNQLTSEEKKFYQKFGEVVKAGNPKQALENADLILPWTTIDRVFEELQTRHPLLSVINFIPVSGAAKIITSTNGYQEAVWGELCDEIVKELLAGFITVDTNLFKLSAFLPVCKAMLDLGPEWLDDFIRQTLYEAYANGAEHGYVAGDGSTEPIGMTRNTAAGVPVVDGKYPEKPAITVTSLDPATLGRLLGMLAVDASGKSRQVRDVILLVNPMDYFTRVMPATTIMAPDGTYRNDILPYPMRIIQTSALEPGQAVIGLAYRYLGLLGSEKDGRIEFSDHYQFLQDNRVYLIKGYANGRPLDANAFLHLDISGLQPAAYKVQLVEAGTPSNVATLSELRIGSLALTPAFASATTTYTAATTNATNTVTATPSDAGATVEVLVNSEAIDNGTAATWKEGANTVTVNVTAADGSTKKAYTVTVTKS